MVQVDVFWSYAIGAGFGAAAARTATRTAIGATRATVLDDRYLTATVLYLGCLFAPSGIWLLWHFTGWETMHATTGPADLPGWLVAAFALTNISQGVLGYLVARALWRRGHRYLAWLQMPLGYLAMFFILTHGWDGTGYRRFLSPTGADWRAGDIDPIAFLTSEVALTLYGMGVVLIPVLVGVQARWWTRGYREAGIDGPGALRLAGLGLLAALGLGLGLAVLATLLLQALGVAVGSVAVVVLLAAGLHPQGPAGLLARAFRLEEGSDRPTGPSPMVVATPG